MFRIAALALTVSLLAATAVATGAPSTFLAVVALGSALALALDVALVPPLPRGCTRPSPPPGHTRVRPARPAGPARGRSSSGCRPVPRAAS